MVRLDKMRPELLNRIRVVEDNFTERKLENSKPEEIRRTLVAFANSVPDGHTAILFLGITNDGTIAGISNPEGLQKKIRDIAERQCYPKITYSCEAGNIEGKIVLAVEVPTSPDKPHFSGPAYVRIGSESVLKARRKQEIKFAVCVTDTEPDLKPRKIYQVLPDEAAEKDQHLRVIDESGEDYLYPASFFVSVEVPKEAERALLLAS